MAVAVATASVASQAASAQGRTPAVVAEPPGGRLVVLPFRDGSCLPIYGNHVMCHITGQHLDAGPVPSGSGMRLAAKLHEALRRQGADLVPFDQGARALARFDPEELDRYEPAMGARAARELGAARAVMGVVARYEERSGAWVGTPAAVSFSVALIDAPTGGVMHRSRFNRSQPPLSSNLLNLPLWVKTGFHWWTRDEIADIAVDDAAGGLTGADEEASWPNMSTLGNDEGQRDWQQGRSARAWEW